MSDQWVPPPLQPGGSWPAQPAPQPGPGLSWSPGQADAYAPQPPSQSSYSQGHQAEAYGQAPGYPTPDPYAAAAHAYLSSPGGYPQAAASYPQAAPYQQSYGQYQQSAASYAPAPPPPAYPPQPPYRPEPPYQPEQPPFPQAPGGPPITPPASGTARPRNAFALTGALTCVLPVVGLVFSIIGLAKAKLLGGIGRSVASAGIALSLVFSAGWGVAGYEFSRDLGSDAADPGCVSVMADYLTYSHILGTDAQAMGEAKYGTKQFTDAVEAYESDLQVLITKFEADAASADHSSVRTAIMALAVDLQQLKTVMSDLATGDFGNAGGLAEASNGKLFTDYEHAENVCAGTTGG